MQSGTCDTESGLFEDAACAPGTDWLDCDVQPNGWCDEDAPPGTDFIDCYPELAATCGWQRACWTYTDESYQNTPDDFCPNELGCVYNPCAGETELPIKNSPKYCEGGCWNESKPSAAKRFGKWAACQVGGTAAAGAKASDYDISDIYASATGELWTPFVPTFTLIDSGEYTVTTEANVAECDSSSSTSDLEECSQADAVAWEVDFGNNEVLRTVNDRGEGVVDEYADHMQCNWELKCSDSNQSPQLTLERFAVETEEDYFAIFYSDAALTAIQGEKRVPLGLEDEDGFSGSSYLVHISSECEDCPAGESHADVKLTGRAQCPAQYTASGSEMRLRFESDWSGRQAGDDWFGEAGFKFSFVCVPSDTSAMAASTAGNSAHVLSLVSCATAVVIVALVVVAYQSKRKGAHVLVPSESNVDSDFVATAAEECNELDECAALTASI